MNSIPRSFRSCSVFALLGLLASTAGLRAAPPAITLQPAVVIANDGASASFTVAATAADPLTFQWRHLGVPLAATNSATLNLPAVTLADAGFYDVVVSAGAESTVSQPGRLLVQPTVVANTFRADPTFALVAEAAGGGVSAVRLTAAGEVLVGGNFTTIAGLRRDGLARLTSSFIYDASFTPAVSGAVNAIVELPPAGQPLDRRIVIGGGFAQVNGVSRSCIARLNSDGSLDPTFFPGTGFNGNVYVIALQPDGRLVVGGSFTQMDGVACGHIARLNPDGSLDPTFNAGSGFDSVVTAIARQSDGRLVVGGYFANVDGHPAARLARVSSSGGFDPTFVLGSGCNGEVLALNVVSPTDDRLLVGGAFTSYAGVLANRVMRLAADGTRDSTFTAPAGINGAVRAIDVATSGVVAIGGDFTSSVPSRCVARLLATGAVDTAFAPPTTARPATSVAAVALYGDGRVVAGGEFTQIGGTAGTASGLVRYSSTGTSNTTPLGALRVAASVNTAVPVASGRWVIGGSFTHLNGVARNRIARIGADGAVDAAFDPGTGFNRTVTSIVGQGDGRLLVAGEFTSFNGSAAFSLVRLESTGGRDLSFGLDSGIQGWIYAMAIQPDGRIVVGGDFDLNNGSARNDLARLQTNGMLDTGFDPGPGQSGPVQALALQRDGRIVAGGSFTQFNAQLRGFAARFNATGGLDPVFNSSTGFDGPVDAVAIRADDSLVLGGAFQNFNGAVRRAVAGFASSGSLLAGYNSGTGLTGVALGGMAALPDGRVLVAGSSGGLVRFNADGTTDTAFAVFDGSLGTNLGVIAAGDGRIFILGPTATRGTARQIGLVVLRPEAAPAATYLNWAALHFAAGDLSNPAISGALADPDGAGVPNLLRYAFGLPAHGPAPAPTQVLTVDEAGLRYLAVRFSRAPASDDLLYTVKSSPDLVGWTTVATLAAGVPTDQTVRDTVPITGAARRFLRVNVELVP